MLWLFAGVRTRHDGRAVGVAAHQARTDSAYQPQQNAACVGETCPDARNAASGFRPFSQTSDHRPANQRVGLHDSPCGSDRFCKSGGTGNHSAEPVALPPHPPLPSDAQLRLFSPSPQIEPSPRRRPGSQPVRRAGRPTPEIPAFAGMTVENKPSPVSSTGRR